jgi:iron complex outermembrane receptor protein
MDRLHVTLGARYTYDEKEAITTTTGLLVPVPDRFEGSNTWGAATWTAKVAYDVADSSMLYTGISRGYAAGGFAFAPVGVNPEYTPEFVTAYEIGSKNRFFNDRLQVNLEAFYNDYTDLSTVYAYVLPNPAGPPALVIGIANGAATYKGATLDVQSILTDHDRLGFAISYLDAKYGDYDLRPYAGSNPIAQAQLVDLSGNQINSTAPWSGNASYTHSFDLFGGTLDTEAALQYRDRTLVDQDFSNTPNEVLTSAETVLRWDFSLRYASGNGKWDVTGYVHNLTDDADYSTLAFANGGIPGAPGFITGVPMEPRTYGVIVGARF